MDELLLHSGCFFFPSLFLVSHCGSVMARPADRRQEEKRRVASSLLRRQDNEEAAVGL